MTRSTHGGLGWRSVRSMINAGLVPPPAPSTPTPVTAAPPPSGEMDIPEWPWKGVRWTLIFVGILAYIYSIVTYEFPISTVAMGLALVGLVVQGGRLRFPAPLIGMLAFLAWSAVGLTQSDYQEAAWEQLVDLFKIFLVTLVVVNALRSSAQIRFFSIFFLGFFALYPVRGALINYYYYKHTLLGRAIWNYAYENPNELAAYCLLHLGLVLGVLATEPNKWLRRAAMIGAGILPVLLFQTQSRGALIAFGIFLVLIAIGHRRELARIVSTQQRKRLVAGAAAVVLAVGVMAPAGVWTRLARLTNITSPETLAQADDERSAEGRMEIWKIAWRVAKDNPAMGVGIGAYPFTHQLYIRHITRTEVPSARGQRDTHSTYLRVLAETGVLGLTIFMAMLVSVFAYANRVRRRARVRFPRASLRLYYLEVAFAAFLFAGLFGTFVYLHFLYIYMALIWCSAYALTTELRNANAAGTPVAAAAGGRRRRLGVV